MDVKNRSYALAAALAASLVVVSGSHSRAVAEPAQGLNASSGTAAAPFATPPTLAGAPDVATLVAKVKPAVVNITATQETQAGGGHTMRDILPFFGGGGGGDRNGGGDRIQKRQALGSGFLIDDKGHVVTNAHVVENATTVKVTLSDEREYSAKVVGKDERQDVAVLKLDNPPKDLPYASLGSSEALRVGEYVVAIGNPFGLGDTVTMGIVSAKGRSIGAGPYDDFIQTDASINPGNSGGPLFDLHGQVIGINTAINPNGKGIGFAIPVDAVRNIVPQLLATGHVSRGRLGVAVQPLDEELTKAMDLPQGKGALVGDVQPGSPAANAGIKAGEVITAVDGKTVPHAEDLPRVIAQHKPGQHVKLTVQNGKAARDLDVVLTELPTEEARASREEDAPAAPHARSKLGIGLAEQDGHPVVARVLPGGAADGKLRPGDVIEEVDRAPVSSASEVVADVGKAASDKPILLRVKRGNESHFVAITPAS